MIFSQRLKLINVLSPFSVNKTYSIIGIFNPSKLCSIIYINKSSVLFMFVWLLIFSSHSPKFNEDKFKFSFWKEYFEIWWILSSFVNTILFLSFKIF